MSVAVENPARMGDSNSRRTLGERTVLAVGIALLVATSSVAVGASTVAVATSSLAVRTSPVAVGASPLAVETTLTSGDSATDFGAIPASQATADNQSSPEYNATVFRDIAGQVATEDGTVAVRGTATGTDRVLAVLIDRRGRVATELLSVNDGEFDEDELPLVTDDGTPLSEGRVVAMVLSPGRDALIGDGEISGITRADIADFETAFRSIIGQRVANRTVSRTQRQVLELFYDQTVEDAGSDDLLLAEEFVYTEGRTTIERVLPESRLNETGSVESIRVGDTMVVRGLTNLQPDENTVFVEVAEGPSADAFDLAATETWGADGVWQVALDTDGVEPGTYTVEAEASGDSDSYAVRVLPRENGSAGIGTPRVRSPRDAPS